MKHIPGPWTVQQDGNEVYITDADGEILVGWWWAIRFPTPQLLALANLLASTPDLLAALEAVEWVNHDLEIVDGKWVALGECPWCDAAQADGHAPDCQRQTARAKAKGK